MDDFWAVAAWLLTWGVIIVIIVGVIGGAIVDRDTKRDIARINRARRGDDGSGS